MADHRCFQIAARLKARVDLAKIVQIREQTQACARHRIQVFGACETSKPSTNAVQLHERAEYRSYVTAVIGKRQNILDAKAFVVKFDFSPRAGNVHSCKTSSVNLPIQLASAIHDADLK